MDLTINDAVAVFFYLNKLQFVWLAFSWHFFLAFQQLLFLLLVDTVDELVMLSAGASFALVNESYLSKLIVDNSVLLIFFHLLIAPDYEWTTGVTKTAIQHHQKMLMYETLQSLHV